MFVPFLRPSALAEVLACYFRCKEKRKPFSLNFPNEAMKRLIILSVFRNKSWFTLWLHKCFRSSPHLIFQTAQEKSSPRERWQRAERDHSQGPADDQESSDLAQPWSITLVVWKPHLVCLNCTHMIWNQWDTIKISLRRWGGGVVRVCTLQSWTAFILWRLFFELRGALAAGRAPTSSWGVEWGSPHTWDDGLLLCFGLQPDILSMAHVRCLTPSPALLFTSAMSLIMIIPGTFTSIVNFFRYVCVAFLCSWFLTLLYKYLIFGCFFLSWAIAF